MSGEAEPRRSVRATKGQHTKSFDEVVEPSAPKRRQTKKSKKAQSKEQEQEQEADDQEEQEEIIRCVCGASEQDEDSGEAWIGCETCFAWQHNVCVGVSSYEDEIPEHYWCEQCRPENHKELLDGIARGEQPWVERRKAHEEKKRRKGGRKPKAKRVSDAKEDVTDKDKETKAKPSPAPDAPAPKEKEATGKGKRKSREDSQDMEGKAAKQRRVSAEAEPPAPARPKYTPPANLEPSITKLPALRTGPAKALKKSLVHVMTSMAKDQQLKIPEGQTVDAMAETLALQIERAVFDTHPMAKGHKEYSQQIKSLTFNLKNNPELVHGLFEGIHTPPTLAVMSSDQLAPPELQQKTAEMRAKAEKQSILYTQENSGPRVRRTHKGEEVVEDETMNNNISDTVVSGPGGAGSSRRGASARDGPTLPIKNEGSSSDQVDLPPAAPRAGSQSEGGGQEPHAGSPSQSNFDISKVFSSVRSPSVSTHARRPSQLTANPNGPGDDPDVDRLLEDENDSPPYSPTEESLDPDVVWRGSLAMSTIADFQATAKHVGGCNFATIGPWAKLIPRRMTVAGRITQTSAIEYLCGLRYSSVTDVVVVSIEPATPEGRTELTALIDYFISKKRYGVVGDKVAGNVRDTYLVPVPPGEDNHPEFMLNLVDNQIPRSRTEPMLLAVFVYRSDPAQIKTSAPPTPVSGAAQVHQGLVAPPTPTPASHAAATNAAAAAAAAAAGGTNGGTSQRSGSISGPAFSPATPSTPQGSFSGPVHSVTPVPIPQVPYTRPQPPSAASPQAAAAALHSPPPLPPHAQGHAAARHSPGQPQSQTPGGPQHQQHPQGSPQPLHAGPASDDQQKAVAQRQGEAMAREVLGPLLSSATVQFLLPQAFQMTRREWEVIRGIYEREPRSKDDLQFLGSLLEKETQQNKAV